MNEPAVAVLDVGKTNKKAILYLRDLTVAAEERTRLEAVPFDGLEREQAGELVDWFLDQLKRFAQSYDIRAVSLCTHGATMAMLGADGDLAVPVISYTSEVPDAFLEEFYGTFGDRRELHKQTATPDLGFVNLAKHMYYVKTRMPDAWARVEGALFLPQYLGYRLTGVRGLDPTYLGNHSYLWDFSANDWSSVAKALGAPERFPTGIRAPWEGLGPLTPELVGQTGLRPDCQVTLGIHDSNANYLPYLAQRYENFILNSTGTWCVAMMGSDSAELSDLDVESKVFYNLDAFGSPVRTSIFTGGLEYENFSKLSTVKDQSTFEDAKRIVEERKLFITPGVLAGTAVWPESTAKVVRDGERHGLSELAARQGAVDDLGQAFHAALNLSLAIQQREVLRRLGARKGTTVFIEGGFSKNRVFCELLAALCPDYTIALTNMQEGTSFGAALTGWMLAEGKTLEDIGTEFTIDTQEVRAPGPLDTAAYEKDLMGLLV